MEVKASVKNIRISPRKLRLVVDVVRGMTLANARAALAHMDKKGAEPVLKLINSAAANAVHNNKLSEETLVVSTITVDEGFTIKRFRARAFGRAGAIRKRTSSINVAVKGQEAAKKAKPKKAAATEEVATAEVAEKKAPTKKKAAVGAAKK